MNILEKIDSVLMRINCITEAKYWGDNSIDMVPSFLWNVESEISDNNLRRTIITNQHKNYFLLLYFFHMFGIQK